MVPKRILNREFFLYFLEHEVKRSQRYQNFFCLLVLTLGKPPVSNEAGSFQTSYRKLLSWLAEDLRDCDIIGKLGDARVAVLLPYADASAGLQTQSHLEKNLSYGILGQEGCELVIRKVCFPSDGTNTHDLLGIFNG